MAADLSTTVVVRAEAPRIVVRWAEILVRGEGGPPRMWQHWQVVEGRKVVFRHDLRHQALVRAWLLAETVDSPPPAMLTVDQLWGGAGK
jgi:hypothetical protein